MTIKQIDSVVKNRFLTGIRGAAILLVLLFHFQIPSCARGFIGVDIFFWLSGLLLTQKLLCEYAANRKKDPSNFGWFDLRMYFLKRIRRVVPLLFGLLFLYSATQIAFNSPSIWKPSLYSILRVATFTYNFQLIENGKNYFDLFSQDNNLSHLWSLSVEEQIYIFIPTLFLFAICWHGLSIKKRRIDWIGRLGITFSCCTVLSLTILIWGRNFSLTSNSGYFSPATRFCEFGLGALVPIAAEMGINSRVKLKYQKFVKLLTWICLIASFYKLNNVFDIWSVLFIASLSMHFTVYQAVNGSKKDLLSKLCSSRILYFLGICSYSIYLVHWPLFVFFSRYGLNDSLIWRMVSLLVAVLLGCVVWALVERPIMRIPLDKFSNMQRGMVFKFIKRNKNSNRFLTIVIAGCVFLSFLFSGMTAPRVLTNLVSTNRNLKVKSNESSVKSRIDMVSKSLGQEASQDTSMAVQSKKNLITITKPTAIPSNSSPVLSKWKEVLKLSSQKRTTTMDVIRLESNLIAAQKMSWANCLNWDLSKSDCAIGTGPKTAYLIGDSYSYALAPALRIALGSGWRIEILTRGSCEPWAGARMGSDGRRDVACEAHNAEVLNYIVLHNPDLIVFSAAQKTSPVESLRELENDFDATMSSLNGKAEKIIVIPAVPGSGDFRYCLKGGNDISGCWGQVKSIKEFKSYQLSQASIKHYKAIDLTPYLCIGDFCPPLIGDLPVYVDGNHLSPEMSAQLGKILNALGLSG